MSDIVMTIKHDCGAAEAKKRILSEIATTASIFQIETDWKANTCHLSGPVRGTIAVRAKDIQVDLTLGFAAKIFRSKIEERLKENVQRIFEA